MNSSLIETGLAVFLGAFLRRADRADLPVHTVHSDVQLDPFSQLALCGVASHTHEVGPLYTTEARLIGATPSMQYALADHQQLEALLTEAIRPLYGPARAVALYLAAGAYLHGEFESEGEPFQEENKWLANSALRLAVEDGNRNPLLLPESALPDLPYSVAEILESLHPEGLVPGLSGHGGIVDARKAPVQLTLPAAHWQFAMVLSGRHLYEVAAQEYTASVCRDLAAQPWGALQLDLPLGSIAVAGFAGPGLDETTRIDSRATIFDETFDATFN